MERTNSFHAESCVAEESLLPDEAQRGWLSEPEVSLDEAECSRPSPVKPLVLPHLPESVIKCIAVQVLSSSNRSCGLLSLMAMCGVCRHWRAAASYLEAPTQLVFDGSKSVSKDNSRIEVKFRLLPMPQRRQVLLACARLFSGYRQATFTGEAIDDAILSAASRATSLTAVAVSSAPSVTDAGIAAIALNCPALETLAVAGVGVAATYGHFLPKLLDLRHLRHLELDTPMLDLMIGSADAPARPMDMTHWPVHSSLATLCVRSPGLHLGLAPASRLLLRLPGLTRLELDGSVVRGVATAAANLREAAAACPALSDVHLLVDSSPELYACLEPLWRMPALRVLDVTAAFLLEEPQLSIIGALPLHDLRLMSQMYKQQPSLARLCCSHLDNQGVKALVDAICKRSFRAHESVPLKLSICGATLLTHDAVSALLRLPVLVKLNISGCNRITAMDKMRLIAKVKAGREQCVPGGGALAAGAGRTWMF